MGAKLKFLEPTTREGQRVCNIDGPGAVRMFKIELLKIKSLAIIILLATASPGFAAGACVKPKAPTLPANGAIITHEQLNNAATLVAGFSKDNMEYKTCLDHIIISPSDHSRTRWREALEAYNQTVPAEQAIWKAYGTLSRDWITANQAKQ